ncbi:hypothetical protein [Reyranella sp.]|uniref:hypothetical protein n=1 Tax=Reyranella sp. TaxID=1929291 RepID=UPI004036B056
MKRKLSMPKPVSPEDLMKSCGILANQAGLTEERRVFFSEDDDLTTGWLSGWTAQLTETLEIEVEASLPDGDESGPYAKGHIGNPLQAVWSVMVWPTPDDDSEEITSPVVEMHHLPFSEALRIASAIIQTHRFKGVTTGA